MKFCVKRNRNNHQEVNEFFSTLYRKVYCSRGEYKNSEYPYNNYDFDFLHYPKGGRHNTKVVFKHKQVGYTELTLSTAKKLFMKEEKVYTLRDLKTGDVGLVCKKDSNINDLNRILNYLFPKDPSKVFELSKDIESFVFVKSAFNKYTWVLHPINTFLSPIQSLDVFVKELNSLQTIVGYKAPFDMAGGLIKKGEVFENIEYQNGIKYYYSKDRKALDTIPAEIVEKWEPEYKCFIKTFTLNGDFDKINITVDKNGFHKDYGEDSFIDYSSMKEIIQPKKFKGGIEQVIDLISIDGYKVYIEQVKNMVEYYEKHFLNEK